MIKLIKNFPYDNKYDYIKLHSSKTEQNNYFNSFSNIIINEGEEEGYIREGESFIVEYNYDYLVSQGINYVIWNNGFKDLFCFIIKKEYVDEEMTRIYYEVDVLNTFLFDFSIDKSFVERKKCNISEVNNYDEGLYIGDHVIDSEVLSLKKENTYFAMFSGIKEQKLTFDSNGNISNVVSIPSPTMKPTTIIDGIPYPIYFMQLFEEDLYPPPVFEKIDIPSYGGNGGDWLNGYMSSDGFRFMKGYEAMAYRPYQDSGGYWTIGYGVTLHAEQDKYLEIEAMSENGNLTEEYCARLGYELKTQRYGLPIVERCKALKITHQSQFDALCDLCFNCGTGSVIGTPGSFDMTVYDAILEHGVNNESAIRPIWENFKVTSNGSAVLPGLVARRKAECDIFFNRKYEKRSIQIIGGGSPYPSGTVQDNNGDGWLP